MTSNTAGHLRTQCLLLNSDHETKFVQPRSFLSSALSALSCLNRGATDFAAGEASIIRPTSLELSMCTLQVRKVVLGMVPRRFL